MNEHREWGDQKRKYPTNLINNLFLFDPIIFEVITHVQNKNGKFIEIVKVQSEHTHKHSQNSSDLNFPQLDMIKQIIAALQASSAGLPELPVVEP